MTEIDSIINFVKNYDRMYGSLYLRYYPNAGKNPWSIEERMYAGVEVEWTTLYYKISDDDARLIYLACPKLHFHWTVDRETEKRWGIKNDEKVIAVAKPKPTTTDDNPLTDEEAMRFNALNDRDKIVLKWMGLSERDKTSAVCKLLDSGILYLGPRLEIRIKDQYKGRL